MKKNLFTPNLVKNGNFESTAVNSWVGASTIVKANLNNPNWPLSSAAQLTDQTSNANYSQSISTTRNNVYYILHFDWAAKANVPLNTSGAKVFFKDVLIRTIKPVDYLVHHEAIEVSGKEGAMNLLFAAIGTSDQHALLIDNVRLYESLYVKTVNYIINGGF